MSKKIILCSFLILSILSESKSTFFSYSIKDIFDLAKKDGYKTITDNPYRVFGLAPWSSMKTIKKKYKDLIKKYHPDKTHGQTKEEFEIIRESYEKIKQARKESEDSDTEISFSFIARDTIQTIIGIEFLFGVLYFICSLIYKLQLIIIIPLIYQIISFTIIDNLIPHYFDDVGGELFAQFIGGIGLLILHKVIVKSFKKSKPSKEKIN